MKKTTKLPNFALTLGLTLEIFIKMYADDTQFYAIVDNDCEYLHYSSIRIWLVCMDARSHYNRRGSRKTIKNSN